MNELQISSIEVKQEDLRAHDCGGGFRCVKAEVVVDSTLPLREQKLTAIYEILGVFLGSFLDRSTLEEIADSIRDGLEILDERT